MSLSSSSLRGVATAAAYGVVSITITLFNKAVFSVYHFSFPLSLFVMQMSITLAALLLLRLLGKIEFPWPTWALARKLGPLAGMWWLYGISGVIAINYLTVPMFSTFRKLSTIVVMAGEFYFLRRIPPVWQAVAVVAMSASALIAGVTDLTASIPGYIWVSVCALSTAGYLLMIATVGSPSRLDNFGLLFYNNLLAFPLMLLSWLLSSERTGVWKYVYLSDPGFLLFFVLTAAQASVLNYLIFLCTRVNSPLTTSITGTIKDLVTNAFGLFVFHDVVFSAPNLISMALCFIASCWYSFLKYQQQRTSQPQTPQHAKERDEEIGLVGDDEIEEQ